MQLVKGQFIWIHEPNEYFSNQTLMLLEHFDTEQYAHCVIVMLDYIRHSATHFEMLYPGKKIIFYQLEQMMGCAKHWWDVNTVLKNLETAYEVWDYDRLNVTNMHENGLQKDVKIVPMLYTTALEKVENVEEPKIDVLFYGAYNDRRSKIFEDITGKLHGFTNTVWVTGVHGSQLDEYIANSKIILNLHTYDPWNRQEQTRMFYPIINGKTVVSEVSQENNMEACVIEAAKSDLADVIRILLKNEIWRYYGDFAKQNFLNATLVRKESNHAP